MAALPRICVLGSLNIDLVSYVPHHPAPGETLTSTSFAVSPGGKGANQAVACAKLSRAKPPSTANASAHVSMIGAVGPDTYGSLLLSNLSTHGVDTSAVLQAENTQTGIAVIIVDEPTGQNRIVLSPGANHSLQPSSLALPTNPLPDLLIMQLEIPLDTVLAALALAARGEGVPVLLNPAPAVRLPEDAYAGLAHLVVNETEASILSGEDVARLDTEEGCREVGGWFVTRGVVNVVITLGGRGVFYLNGHDKKSGLVQAEKVKEVVDTTAAGDTFVGQYALEVVAAKGNGEAFDLEAAVKKANRAAARTVERKGAQDSIPWRDELA